MRRGLVQSVPQSADAYKDTEQRLYNLPVLKLKVDDDKERLIELRTDGSPVRSKSIVRFSRSGSRLKPDEILDALIKDITVNIAASEYEINTVEKALTLVERDPYYTSLSGRYFKNQCDDDIAEGIPCDPATIRRNRKRLMRTVAVYLYGVEAVKI